MPEREKVIKGLECCDYCNSLTNTCFQCPYLDLNKEKGLAICTAELAHDALALLREQEPVKTEPVRFRVVRVGGSSYPFWDCVCEGCGFKTAMAHTDWRFCPECGKAVKWDG